MSPFLNIKHIRVRITNEKHDHLFLYQLARIMNETYTMKVQYRHTEHLINRNNILYEAKDIHETIGKLKCFIQKQIWKGRKFQQSKCNNHLAIELDTTLGLRERQDTFHKMYLL
jgi:hypothetical protein